MTAHHCTPACTRGWGPSGRCHCASCGESFTTWRNFDRHRVRGACVEPSSVGLVRNDRGLWRRPGSYHGQGEDE